MGRSGGGGGRRSGGSRSSGSRSSGGFSGGRSSDGRSSNSTHTHHHGYRSFYKSSCLPGTPACNEAMERKNNLFQVAFICLFFFIFIITIMANQSSPTITKSTYERTPLDYSLAEQTSFYTDDDGTWVYNSSKLEDGLKYFYDKTGVWPYVYIMPNGSSISMSYSDELYDELFNDEAHFLMVFVDDGNGGYDWYYTGGSLTKTIMDEEAANILNDYLEMNYNNRNISEEEIFSNAFRSTADRIMSVSSDSIFENLTPATILCIIFSVVVVIIFILCVLHNRKIDKEKRDKELMETLTQPLETFGESDSELDELIQRYNN